jgi:hypothetical protein
VSPAAYRRTFRSASRSPATTAVDPGRELAGA